MKISLGYYRIIDGSFIANEMPIMDTDYYHVIATLRRKICEYPDSTPYKRHAVKEWQRTYCDENRLFVRLFEYRDRKKIREIRSHWCFFRATNEDERLEKDRHIVYNAIIQNVVDKYAPSLLEKYHITNRRYVYLPSGIDVNWGPIVN